MISVIIPAYNAARYLGETLDSIQAQTLQAAEIIVVDDGSTDDTAAVATRRGVTCLQQANRGSAAAMNTGFLAASGDLLASVDADDLWLPDKLQRQSEALAANPDVDMVFGHIEQFICPTLDPGEHRLLLTEANRVLPGYSSITMLVRRDAFLRVGAFSTDHTLGDFVEWLPRAGEAGLVSMMLPEIVARRRLHGNNVSLQQKHSRADFLRILKSKLDRQRNAAGDT